MKNNEWKDVGCMPRTLEASFFGTSLLKLPKEFTIDQKAHTPPLVHKVRFWRMILLKKTGTNVI